MAHWDSYTWHCKCNVVSSSIIEVLSKQEIRRLLSATVVLERIADTIPSDTVLSETSGMYSHVQLNVDIFVWVILFELNSVVYLLCDYGCFRHVNGERWDQGAKRQTREWPQRCCVESVVEQNVVQCGSLKFLFPPRCPFKPLKCPKCCVPYRQKVFVGINFREFRDVQIREKYVPLKENYL